MLLEIVIVSLPFLVMIVVMGLGHDITDPTFISEQEGIENANLD